MSETVLILRATKYDFISDKNESIKGCNVHFINDYQVETETAVGDAPMKVAASEEVFTEIKKHKAPGIYEINTRTKPGKDGQAIITKINARPRKAISAYLIQDENGQPLTQGALRSRFDKARTLAKVDFQFRDIRAKAATDTGDQAHSQKLLAHKNREMTEHYVKARMGERVKPLR